MSEVLREVVLRRLRLPLLRPYRLSYRTFTEFEPIIVQLRSQAGKEAWGEGHISPGSSDETRDGGWAFCRAMAQAIVGKDSREAETMVSGRMHESKVAATAITTAIEMLEKHPALQMHAPVQFPLVAAFQAAERREFQDEAEALLSQGYRTFKVKVGNDVRADIERVTAIQTVAAGRAVLRIDANRGYSEADAIRFATALDPAGIELFEQPCAAEDWDANARVAKFSTVPLMLDEPICSPEDIQRAGQIEGVGFCKLKLKRFGGVQRLRDALAQVRARGMEPILGDGLSSEITCWMEACASIGLVTKAGEFNGFLKPATRLFVNPLPFSSGALQVPADFHPVMDMDVLRRHDIVCERFTA